MLVSYDVNNSKMNESTVHETVTIFLKYLLCVACCVKKSVIFKKKRRKEGKNVISRKQQGYKLTKREKEL